MENWEALDKQALVDKLVMYTQEFADAYLFGKSKEEMDNLRKCIETLQREIMSRSNTRSNTPSQDKGS